MSREPVQTREWAEAAKLELKAEFGYRIQVDILDDSSLSLFIADCGERWTLIAGTGVQYRCCNTFGLVTPFDGYSASEAIRKQLAHKADYLRYQARLLEGL